MTPLILGVKAAAHLFLHAGQCRAALPQQQSRSVVACRQRRRGRETLVKVLPRGRSHVRRGREIDDCFGTLGRRYRKKLSQPSRCAIGPPGLLSLAGGFAHKAPLKGELFVQNAHASHLGQSERWAPSCLSRGSFFTRSPTSFRANRSS